MDLYWKMNFGCVYNYPINPYNTLRIRINVNSGVLPLPYTKYSFVGGIGSLRGYNINEFKGGEVVLANLEYERYFYTKIFKKPSFKSEYNRAGLLLFLDYAEIGSLQSENFSWDLTNENYDYVFNKVSIGCGVIWNNLYLLAAKRMDRNVNDWSFILQVCTFLDREYPYPK